MKKRFVVPGRTIPSVPCAGVGLILCLGMIAGIGLADAGLSQTYHWPLDAEPILTSSFCEYRTAHFHSGIDLSTMRKVGLDVFSVGPGYVWRVKTSPWGSGKTLYVKLDDGNIAVYFHLSGYAPAIRRLAEEEQERTGRYSIDLFPEPGAVRVLGGEVIAYSGDTGTGGPHLHFDFRDQDNRPLNPLLNGFATLDTLSPVITGLCVTPLCPDARVEGTYGPAVIPVHAIGPEEVEADRPVHVSGPVGLGVRATDHADSALNRLSVYSTDLLVDDQLVFRRQYNGFPFDRTRQVDLDRDFSLMSAGRGQFERLYVAEGNSMPFYSQAEMKKVGPAQEWPSSPASAWFSQPGWHRLRVVVADAAGNEAQADMDLLVNRPPVIWEFSGAVQDGQVRLEAMVGDSDDEIRLVRFECSTDSGASWKQLAVDSLASPLGASVTRFAWSSSPLLCRARALDANGEWSAHHFWATPTGDGERGAVRPRFRCEPVFYPTCVEWDISADGWIDREPVVTVTQNGGSPRLLELTRLDHRRFSSMYAFLPGLDGQAVLRLEADPADTADDREVSFDLCTVSALRGGTVVSVDSQAVAVFDSGDVYATFWARTETGTARRISPYISRSKAYRFMPEDVPFGNAASIRLRYSGRPDRLGVYRQSRGEWKFAGSEFDTLNGWISAPIYSFGTFAVMEDTLRPEVWNLRPANGFAVGGHKVALSASLDDEGSGIGREQDIAMELDGRRVISEYDPEARRLRYQVPGRLGVGEHVLSVSVTDMAGNRTVKSSRFSVSK